jgi:uncharacterized protein YdhG (YjbR/CyaY superfamily)
MHPEVQRYIDAFPEDVQIRLNRIREMILSCSDDIVEGYSYNMPAYRCKKPIVYYAAYAKHIGIYPGSSGVLAFESELLQGNYHFSKGAIQFPLNKELPLAFIERIVRFKIKEQS